MLCCRGSQGSSLGLWHGVRLLPSGPPAAPPPLGVAWVHEALVGRARARLAVLASPADSIGRGGAAAAAAATSAATGAQGARAVVFEAPPPPSRPPPRESPLAGPPGALDLVVEDCEAALAVWPFGPEPLRVLSAVEEER